MAQITPKATLDCVGLYCPEPVFRTRKMLDELKAGEVLEVLADDPSAKEDIPRLVRRLGYEMLSMEDEANYTRFLIKKA